MTTKRGYLHWYRAFIRTGLYHIAQSRDQNRGTSNTG